MIAHVSNMWGRECQANDSKAYERTGDIVIKTLKGKI